MGIKLSDGEFIELISIRRSRDGFIMWTPQSEKHYTVIDEGSSVSSHVSSEVQDEKYHLGRLEKDVIADEDEFLERLFNPRKMDEEEYSKRVVFLHDDWFSFFSGQSWEMKTEETKKEIIQYFDLNEIFEIARKFFDKFADKPFELMWVGQADDILTNDDLEYALTFEQRIIMEFEGDLYELDTAPMNILNEDNPLSEYFKPLGFSAIIREANLRFQSAIEDE